MAEWQRWKNIMKCVPFSEDRLLKWKPPYIVQPKYDGFRCRAMPIETGLTRNEYLLLSSEENIFYSVPHLNEIFSNLNLRSELDGELYCHGIDFNSLSSIVSRTINLHPDYKRVQFHCFDIINDQPQMKRLLQIENLREVSPWIVVSPFWVCETLDDIMMAYDKLIELKYEGIIVRHYMAPYERKRSTMLMKFKPKKDDTYKIVNVVEEVSKEGIPKNRLGALVCKSGDGNLFHVGTGFNDEERERLWNNRETLPGMNAKVQYQHLTTGKQVPRFPVFVEVIDND
jgi:DNA ligase-1